MIGPMTILILIGLILFYVINKISTIRLEEINALEDKRKSLINKYEYMVNQRNDLQNQIIKKEQTLTTLRNNETGLKTISAKDLDMSEIDENEKISRYLIQEGKITLEQNENTLKKMNVLQMDYLGACLALGYIDLETAKKTMKINKISIKTKPMN